MSAETQKPWEMNQKEYEQWYQDNMGEKEISHIASVYLNGKNKGN